MSIEETNSLLKQILEELKEVVKRMPKPKATVPKEHIVRENRMLD